MLITFDYSVINVPKISVERFQSQLKMDFKRRSALTSTHARVHNRTILKADAVIEIESETSNPTCVCVRVFVCIALFHQIHASLESVYV